MYNGNKYVMKMKCMVCTILTQLFVRMNQSIKLSRNVYEIIKKNQPEVLRSNFLAERKQ